MITFLEGIGAGIIVLIIPWAYVTYADTVSARFKRLFRRPESRS